MPHGQVSEILPARSDAAFDLVHDYSRRLDWDTLLQAAYLEEGGQAAAKGMTSVCVGRGWLGGIALRTVYVTFRRPTLAAVKMVNTPLFFESWAASIHHEDISAHESRITYTFHFTTKPRYLRRVLDPVVERIFTCETKKRLRALREFLARAKTAITCLFLAAFLFGLCDSSAFGQWQAQTVRTKSDFRGLCAVTPDVAWGSGTMGTYARTTDGGKTWLVGTVPGAEKLDFRDVEAFGEATAYLLSAGPGDASRIYKTMDGGKSWTMQFKSADPAAFLDAIAFWDQQNGIALGDPVNGRFQLIVTADGGATWKQLAPATLPAALPGEGAFAASGTCLVTHAGRDVWFATGGAKSARVFHSADRGRNWEVSETPIMAGAESAGIFSIAFRDPTHGMIVGGDYRKPTDIGATAAATSDGGKTWIFSTGGCLFARVWRGQRIAGSRWAPPARMFRWTTAPPGGCLIERTITASDSMTVKAGRLARKAA
jgi:photosystem II stability/assembly factor-like uncharacterized protein